jgi:hypothetical protein
MDAQRDDSLPAQLAEARLALYHPDADEATRARYRALRGRTAPATDGAPPSWPTAEADPATGRLWIRAKSTLGVALVLLVVLVGVVRLADSIVRGQRRPLLSTTLPLATAIDRERSALPAGWRNGPVAAARDDLDGAIPLHAHGSALLVVRCPSGDRSFQADAGPQTLYGVCGRPVFIALRDGSRVVVTTRGVTPFSAALLSRDVGS